MAEEKENKNGLIEWKMTGNLLSQFKSAKHNESFESPQFKTIDGTTWRISVYPHGDGDASAHDHCVIDLECVKLNANKPRIGVNYTFNVMEMDWIQDGCGETFKCDGDRTGHNAFEIEQLMNVDSLTIKCFVEETMDVSEENTYFEWKITNYWLNKWENAKYEQVFLSPVFNAMGQEWQIAIFPNGYNIEGTADLCISCDSIESDDEIELNVCHYIGIDAVNHCQIHFHGNIVNKDDGNFACTSPFQLDDIQNESEISICVKIWERGSIDRNEGQLIANIYSDKMKKLQRQSAETIHDLQTEHLERDKEMTSLRHENEELKSKAQKATMDHMEAIKSLNSFTQSLQSENKRLQTENSELNEECKEIKLELIRVKKELRKGRINTRNYLEWTDLEVVDWIISIHDGEYAQYEQELRLLFAKESVNGAVLAEISKSDLKDWGIHNFSHRSNIYKQIQKLINQQSDKAIQNIEGQGNTAYIG